MEIAPSILMFALYRLYYIDDVTTFDGFSADDLLDLKDSYDEHRVTLFVESVHWAVAHPEYDFLSVLPNLPHSNAAIYQYVCKICRSLESL